jgi:hypothetical protein
MKKILILISFLVTMMILTMILMPTLMTMTKILMTTMILMTITILTLTLSLTLTSTVPEHESTSSGCYHPARAKASPGKDGLNFEKN